jgi:hypothetical protein
VGIGWTTSGQASSAIIVGRGNARPAEAARPLARMGDLARQLDEPGRRAARRGAPLAGVDPPVWRRRSSA